ncbi:aldehyde dehydrogenase family protein [Sphingobium sp. H39-3-25]|uniref:aldehyde dehydrogenase family protein n=1 Tax=Sphingobium arseniciresistens TaxID=3030834 RepID=UPI0023BA0FE6|nr:aldehyde dehydrogenase family protein [Sphingobium arseniciresistens]
MTKSSEFREASLNHPEQADRRSGTPAIGDQMRIYVDGQWVASTGTESIAVIDPATEETIGSVIRGTAEDVDRAVQAAAGAFDSWSNSSLEDRKAIFRKLAELTAQRVDEITRTIVAEVGQPISSARVSQSAGAVDELRIMADALDEISWVDSYDGAEVRREAAGIVGAITAWNAPLRSIISKAGAAMAAGCTVVLKSSEVAPFSAYIFAEMAEEAGIPAGVFNLVTGTGPEVGEAIAQHPLIDLVSLTGSVRAGQRVMTLASETVKRVHLELGGKSANMIFEGADFEQAISTGIADAFRNAGQVCGGLTRVLVPRTRLAEAEELAVAAANGYVIGDPFDPATTLGPVITAVQRERIRDFIRSAPGEGARLLTGGAEMPEGMERGFYVRPTIFTGDNSMCIAREEIFGPVVTIIPFDTEDEAFAIANDSSYGLAGGIWAETPERARAMARRLRTGRIRINGAPISKLAPHGGFKLSGIGREWGRYGVEEFLEYKSVNG